MLFITILEKSKVEEIYNIGFDKRMEYSILDVPKILIKIFKGIDDYNEWLTFIEVTPLMISSIILAIIN